MNNDQRVAAMLGYMATWCSFVSALVVFGALVLTVFGLAGVFSGGSAAVGGVLLFIQGVGAFIVAALLHSATGTMRQLSRQDNFTVEKSLDEYKAQWGYAAITIVLALLLGGLFR